MLDIMSETIQWAKSCADMRFGWRNWHPMRRLTNTATMLVTLEPTEPVAPRMARRLFTDAL